jgi:hypothetical protein
VPFQAIAASGDSVNWSTKTQYSTSGGVPAAASTASFKTANDATQYNTYSGIGGQMTIGATSGPYSDSVTITLSGTYIDDCAIESTLSGDYTCSLVKNYTCSNGQPATPSLFELIAWKESTFHPFYLETLYGIWALWPYESFATSSQPAGYNIGLMMPTLSNKYVGSMATALDWAQNATAGADTFASKVTLAVNEIQTLAYGNKKLSAITASELEDIGLLQRKRQPY